MSSRDTSDAAGRAGTPSHPGSSEPPPGPHPLSEALGALRGQLDHLEDLVRPGVDRVEAAERRVGPAWQRSHRGESRFPVAIAVAVAIAAQIVLPNRLDIRPTWLLPSLEAALLLGIVAANPRRVDRASSVLRSASVGLIALISVANAWSSVALVRGLADGTDRQSAAHLLTNGASIYVTNVIVFSLWYWEWDRGGSVARAQGRRRYPDFLFPQMTQSGITAPSWVPTYLDYLYVSFTNATAFSPTDTMPLARWAKVLMLLQSAVSLAVISLVIARAVNIL